MGYSSIYKKVCLWLAFCFYLQNLHAQSDSSSYKIHITKKQLVTTGIIVQQAASFYIEYKWWWEGNYDDFNFENDQGFNSESLGADKLGHAFTSYLFFNALNEAMIWGEYKDKSRLILSTTLPAVWALSIEIGDGFSPFGFSFRDLAANFTGIGFGLLQQKVPYFKNITFKFSYWPVGNAQTRQIKGVSLAEDYDGHSYWLSFNLHKMLPKKLGQAWPEWLNIAAGYSIDQFRNTEGKPFQRELLIGFDLNLNAFTCKTVGGNGIKNIANLFHIPAPGVKFTDQEKPQAKLFLKN